MNQEIKLVQQVVLGFTTYQTAKQQNMRSLINSDNNNDDLDGDFLSCNPSNVTQGFEFLCYFGLPVLGSAILLTGLCFFYLVFIQRRHRKLLARQVRDAAVACAAGTRHSSHQEVHSERDATDAFSYIEKLLLSLGVGTVCYSVSLFVYGVGTMYPTTHIRGQMGDIAMAFTHSAWWYNSLLQYRGAIYFKSSVPQPQGLSNQHNKSTSRFHMLLSVSTLLDLIQSWFAPVIAFLLWGFLRAGIYTRGWYYFYMFSFTSIYGMRGFVAIVSQRLHTLRHVVAMVNAKSGTREEKTRRNGFVISKTTSLVLDFISVFCMSVLLPISYLLFGSTFNSRALAVHAVIQGIMFLIPLTQKSSNRGKMHIRKKVSRQ